jgi:ABC-type multidrug transport system fused ATPase/permease subunit
MQRPVDQARVVAPSRAGSFVRRSFRWLFLFAITLLTLIGLITVALLSISWMSAAHWTLAEFQDTAHGVAAFTQKNFVTAITIAKNVLELASLVLIAIAAFVATIRMPMLARIIHDFITARGSIYTLQNTITDANKMVQSVSSLEPMIQMLADKVDDAQVQLGELQRYTSSQRSAPGDADGEGPIVAGSALEQSVIDDARNWEKLRGFYYANTGRVEGIIDKIPDLRKKNRYRKMRKSNYSAIIRALAKDGFIGFAAEKASIDLNNTFKSYQPRNRRIPDKVIGDMEVLDAQLEQLIGKPPPEDEEERPPQAPTTQPPDAPRPPA